MDRRQQQKLKLGFTSVSCALKLGTGERAVAAFKQLIRDSLNYINNSEQPRPVMKTRLGNPSAHDSLWRPPAQNSTEAATCQVISLEFFEHSQL